MGLFVDGLCKPGGHQRLTDCPPLVGPPHVKQPVCQFKNRAFCGLLHRPGGKGRLQRDKMAGHSVVTRTG